MSDDLQHQNLWSETVTPARLWRLTLRVIRRFSSRRGLLLAGGVAYNTLLSLIPLMAVLLSALSLVVGNTDALIGMVSRELEHFLPGQAEIVVIEVQSLMGETQILGGVGLLVLLFFSSFTFRMFEESMAVIFDSTRKKRAFWVSALMPYAYVFFFGIILLLMVGLSVVLQMADVPGISGLILYLFTFAIQVFFFASLYYFMPVAVVPYRRSLVGGLVVAFLWELVRTVLGWYFLKVSLVNSIYGSLATVVVAILSLEVAAIILLLGACVIAELQRSEDLGLLWYEEPPLIEE